MSEELICTVLIGIVQNGLTVAGLAQRHCAYRLRGMFLDDLLL